MENQQVKTLIDDAFNQIKKATTIEDLIKIESGLGLPRKNLMSATLYPPIHYSITPDDITTLQKAGLIKANYELSPDLSRQVSDPLAKLLYALIWKNGDLKKVKHIVAGITNQDEKQDVSKDDGLVFYQFGKFLKQQSAEPIIDQHVLRAFGIHIAEPDDDQRISMLRKLSVVTKKEKELIAHYKEWLKAGPGLQDSLRSAQGYSFHIDKLLFALGKTVKLTKSKSAKEKPLI